MAIEMERHRLGHSLAFQPGVSDFCFMQEHIAIIRRARLRKELKPLRVFAPEKGIDPDWVMIAHARGSKGCESFDLVFVRADGTASSWMGFETLVIAKAQAHALVGIEYVEWEPCSVEVTNPDNSVAWERALPEGEFRSSCAGH